MQRVPELEALTDDPKIRRAIESGDPFKVYRALVLARLFCRLPAHKELLKMLTGERRLFVKPLKGTPSLISFNSVGFGFVGKAEKNSDDSYIAMHAVVVLFAVPLIPLGAYVVRDNGSRQYQIYARAPLGIMGWLYTRGLALMLVLSVFIGAASSYRASGNQDLIVLNGFDVPLTVDIGAQAITLAPNSRATVTLPVGKVTGTARAAKGGVIDTFAQDMHSSSMLSIWNVAGAAPLVRDTVVYTKTPRANDGNNAFTVYCGIRFIELAGVEYAFVQPPQTLSMSKHQDSRSVQHLDVMDAKNMSGADACLQYGFGQGHEKDVAKVAEAVAQLKGWSQEYAGLALFAAQNDSPAEAVRVARRAAAAHPDDVRSARMLQDVRDMAGQHEAMLKEHAARAQAHPDSAVEQYLYAVLLPGQPGTDAMQALALKFPQDAVILRSLAWRKAAHGDYPGALRDATRLHQLSRELAEENINIEVRTLLALHRGAEALALLDRTLRDPAATHDDGARVGYALVARQMGGDADRYLRPAAGEKESALRLDWLRVNAGLQPLQSDSEKDPAVKMALALRDAPEVASRAAATISPSGFAGMSAGQLALLYAEAARRQHAAVSEKMSKLIRLSSTEDALLRRFVRGEAVSLDEADLEIDMQAAACFIRSRNPSLSAAEREALRLRAAKLDLLQGAVTTALKQWPKESTI
ncbi:MAG: hypothetical protein ABIT83_19580 [Massilia sp.]